MIAAPVAQVSVVRCGKARTMPGELGVQAAALCGPQPQTRFIVFPSAASGALRAAMRSALDGRVSAFVLPLELCPEEISGAERRAFRALADELFARSIPVFVASGNQRAMTCAARTPQRFPADDEHVVTVGVSEPGVSLAYRGKPDFTVPLGSGRLGGSSLATALFALQSLRNACTWVRRTVSDPRRTAWVCNSRR